MNWRQRTRNPSLMAVVFLLGMGPLSTRAAATDAEESARKQAAKANQLAARNKCAKAIFAFTRAYKTLKDPTLLFNRAECFRKVGRDDEAIADYEQFLAELPQASNRAAVQARIAALRTAQGGMPRGREKPAPATPAPPGPAEKAPPPAALIPATKPAETAPSAPGRKPTPFPEPESPGNRRAAGPAVPPKTGDKPAAAPAAATPATSKAADPMVPASTPPAGRAERWTD